MYLYSIIVSLLGLTHLADAARRPKPWEITRLTTFSPTGRPGDSPWSVINITISDPNDSTVSPTICVGKWTWEELPYGKVNACSEVPGGQWAFSMLESDSENPSPTVNFRLRFELRKTDRRYMGTAKFDWDNLSGLCSASGFCSFGLKEEKTPFPVSWYRVHN
ncbi:hypothetical protein N657DRAFT_650170 [Parathielavia appendiculata]|uniref:AA1-like domain-containing protein n=1 Tax=Parathielavia appendiculata TaxID=2587402 RepID=A0AAN6YZN9_9PEZI|nr:hypothetical protein N657DRAFT_650170 [Parathielavia appendiculata]